MSDVALAPDEKKCRFCAEIIKKDAIVCKHCGRDLSAPASPPSPSAQPIQPKARPKEKMPPVLILVFIFIVVASCYLLFNRTSDTKTTSSTSSIRDEAAACSVMADRKFNMNIPLGDIKSASINGDSSASTVRITTTDGSVKWNITCDMLKNKDGNWAGISVTRR